MVVDAARLGPGSGGAKAEEARSVPGMMSAMPHTPGDAVRAGHPEQVHGGVAQGGHHLCARSPANLRPIFVEGDVADLVPACR
jgi:hypothetical protein